MPEKFFSSHNRPEITWSLMHPVRPTVEYMRKVVENASRYRVDSFEICGDCHETLGGMEGFLLYEDYPRAAARRPVAEIRERRRIFNEIIGLAHDSGRPVYFWHREIMLPDGLLEDCPELLDENGEFDLLGEAYEKLLRNKLSRTFDAVPGLDGIVLTLTESDYSVIHNSNTEKYPPQKVVDHLVRIFTDEHQKRHKRFILRSFGSIAKDYEDILGGAETAARDCSFEVETKITPYDFDPFLPINPFLRRLPGAGLGAECDGLGEFLGAGILPAENLENIVSYVRNGRQAGVTRYVIRLDRIGNSIFDSYEINLYAYSRAIDDETVTAEQLRSEWADAHYPTPYRQLFLDLGKLGLEMIKQLNFIDGNVIFHAFPLNYELKYIKAGFITSVFRNGSDLHLGRDVWSILDQRHTPGRQQIRAEKEQALLLAETGLLKLLRVFAQFPPSLPEENREFAWRFRLWSNAVVAARAIGAFVNCLCAYFDDMEAGNFEAPRLGVACEAAVRIYETLAKEPLPDGPAAAFSQTVDHGLYRGMDGNLDIIYLAPLKRKTGLLLEEFHAETTARRKFSPGTFDCIITGAIADDYRCGRSMHASHATIRNGLPVRYVGNTVFPNGILTFELKRPATGGTLTIYGAEPLTAKILVSLDGTSSEQQFDNDGKCTLPLPAGQSPLAILKIAKLGAEYPVLQAITVVSD